MDWDGVFVSNVLMVLVFVVHFFFRSDSLKRLGGSQDHHPSGFCWGFEHYSTCFSLFFFAITCDTMVAYAIGRIELRLPCRDDAMENVRINFMASLKAELQGTLRSCASSRSTACVDVESDTPTDLDDAESKLQQEVEELAAERGLLLQSVHALRGTMAPGVADCLNVSAGDTLAVPLSGPLVVTCLIAQPLGLSTYLETQVSFDNLCNSTNELSSLSFFSGFAPCQHSGHVLETWILPSQRKWSINLCSNYILLHRIWDFWLNVTDNTLEYHWLCPDQVRSNLRLPGTLVHQLVLVVCCRLLDSSLHGRIDRKQDDPHGNDSTRWKGIRPR